MKKLNNKGFGLTTAVVLICVLAFVVIFVSILAYRYGIDKNSPNVINNTSNTTMND